jgi:hypothetical protein
MSSHDDYNAYMDSLDDAQLQEMRESQAYDDYIGECMAEMHDRIQEAKKVAISYPHDQKWYDSIDFLRQYAPMEVTI